MLITIYEEDNSSYFKGKFQTPLTLPKNAEIKLLKAYIPRDHTIVIDNTNNKVSLLAHTNDDNAFVEISLVNGKYGVEALARHIQTQINSVMNTTDTTNVGQLRHLGVYVSASIENNRVGNDTFKFFIRPRTISPSFYYDLNFDSVGNQISGGNFETNKNVGGDTYTIVKTTNNLRCSVYDNAGAKKGWDNNFIIKRNLDRQRFGARRNHNPANNLVALNDTHSLVSFKIGNISGNSFWVGLKQTGSALDVSGCPINDLSGLSHMVGCSVCVAVYGETANGKTANRIEIFEDHGGTFTLLGGITDVAVAGDTFIIGVPNNASNAGTMEYYIKLVNGELKRLNVGGGHRLAPPHGQNYEICGGFYNGSGNDNTILELSAGMDAGYLPQAGDTTKGAGKFEFFGRYLKLALSGGNNDNKNLQNTLGYQHAEYEQDNSGNGGGLGDALNQENEEDMITNDEKQPFINVNITNLPISSITASNSNSSDIANGETQHDYSKCVASIPRFNQDDGAFDNLAIMFDDNTQSIKLNNSSECILSSFDFRLQNCDGTYPTDLLTPSSYVFQVSGDNLN